MSGGGGDAPPTPLSGGEFLLRLLQNPPQQSRRRQQPLPPSPSPSPSAAVGPALTPLYRSNPPDHNYSSSRSNNNDQHFAPHNFFPQNPNPNLSPPQIQNQQQSHHFYNHNNVNGGNPDFNLPRHHPHQQQQQQAQTKTNSNLVFGSFSSSNSGVSSSSSNSSSSSQLLGRDYYDRGGGGGLGMRVVPNGLDVEFQKSLELNREHEFNRRGEMPGRRTPPPPGFSGNGRGAGSRSWSGGFERKNRVKGKGKYGDVGFGRGDEKGREVGGAGGGVSVERRVIGQFDRTGVPSGSNVHSVRASDFEESMLKLREEVGGDHMERESDVVSTEVDDLDEHGTGMSVPEDESAEKSDKKKQRHKDYRADKRGKWILNQRMRSFRRQIECRSDINLVNGPFLEIYESLIPSEEEKAKQKQLLALLEKHVTKEWPEACLFLYGSCANSFGFRKSDIDVCLAIEDADVNKSEVLLKLADILKSDNLQNVQALTHARVPIVKLMDPATGISCDICVNNLLAVINTKLLRDYALIDTRLRQLAFIVKHWAKLRGVNETYRGTLSSYAYVLMCIHFLQQRTPPILPCLQGMDKTYAVNVDNTECAYYDQVEKLRGFGTRNTESIAQLVWAFFGYWAYCHDYTNEVISVRMGRTLRKHDKDWTRRIGNDRHLICIEDPFEISHDLGRVVDKFSIRVLREEFERAAEIMQYDTDPCVTLFQPYVPS